MDTDSRKTVIKLRQWNVVVFKAENQLYEKILGYDAFSDSFHISSIIVEFDRSSGRAWTETNGYYELIGEPGALHPKAQIIYEKLKAHRKLSVKLKYPIPVT